ncbi:MAG: HEAT repeat domain-containing protein [Verrucomicrobiales bacterium]|nr:HEAT repeat domain-containing protein [Verrucomicrobiales bacterium]
MLGALVPRTWLRLGILAGLVGALLGFGPASAAASKSAADYARDLESGDRNVKREAAYQLSRMGREALAALPQLIKALEDDQQQVWFGAITALANLGPDAEPALPALQRELESWEPSRRDRQGLQALYRTAAALGAVGQPALPSLTNDLVHARWHVRAGAAMALGYLRPPALETIPGLLGLLGDERAEAREAALETLVGFGGPAVEPLVQVLKSERPMVARRSAAEALGRIGPKASSALDAVRAALESDKETAVRVACVSALARLGGHGADVVPMLLATWRQADPPVSAAAKRELLLVRPVRQVLMPKLLEELEHGDVQRRGQVAQLLRELGPDSAAAVPVLIRFLRETPAGVAGDADMIAAVAATGEAGVKAALAEVERSPQGVQSTNHWVRSVLRRLDGTTVPALGEALSHASPVTRAMALQSLAALGPAARAVSRQVIGLLTDPAPEVRAQAWTAAAACGANPEVLLARFDDGLKDPDPEVRVAAIDGVARLGRGARSAVPKLVDLMNGSDPRLQIRAVRALADLGQEGVSAADSVATRLTQAPPELQVELLAALGSMGTGAASTVGKLGVAAESPRHEVRCAMLDAVGRFGESGREALGWVTNGVRDPHPAVRASAILAWAALDPNSDGAAGAVVESVGDGEAQVRRGSLEAAIKLGEKARAAESQLFALLKAGTDRDLVLEAIRAVRPTSVPDLKNTLSDTDWKVRQMAADALSRLGKSAEGALPTLEKMQAEDPSEDVKRACRRAVRRIREG